MAVDFFGEQLAVGQTIACVRPQYRDMVAGVVLKLTPKKAHIMYVTHSNTYDRTIIDHSQLIITTHPKAVNMTAKVTAKAKELGWLEDQQ